MKAIALLALVGLLSACASQTPSKSSQSSQTVARSSSTVDSVPVERAKIHTELGVSYYQAGHLGVALEELNTAVAADRTYAPAYDALGLVYMELKEDERAESNFKQALKINPNASETKNNYGLFLCQRNREKEGLRLLLDALKNPLYSTPDVAYKNAGTCARKAGDLASAELYFQRAVKLNPAQTQALLGLADVSYARSDYPAAKATFGRYIAVVPNPGPDALWLGARIENRLGDRAAVTSYGTQLRRRFPSAPETKAYLDGRFE